MKKQFLITICAALILAACGQKKGVEQQTHEGPAAKTENSYDYLNPSQEEQTGNAEDLSGKVIALTAEEFRAKITDINPELGLRYKGHTPCIVDFYADWCGPCMQLKPITEKLAAKYKGQLIIYKVNVDRAEDVCQSLGIQSIPTLFFFKPNTQPKKIVGAPSERELEKTIEDFLK
ncbi:MAG: thioredoxin family protein [Bacteroidales bacterium]|nr:thioredoxin family protein [Bacteroidales bacterium]